jgi:hypothetical protein
LEEIELLIAIERTLTLSSEKRGAKGQITIMMVFQPEIIMRTRKSTSTISAAGRTMTAIGTAPMSARRGVLQGVVPSGTSRQSSSTDPGILRVSVLNAKGLIGGQDVKPYAVVRVGETEFKTKHAGKTVNPEWYVCS